MATTWEHKEFVYTFPPDPMWARLGSAAHSEAWARLEFWQAYQRWIWEKLQTWLDDGWEPVGEVGPASITLRTYKETFKKWDVIQWLAYVVVGLLLFGIPWFILPFLWMYTIARPVEFRLHMRRARR